ncbi:MAG: hypothetical protein H6738_23550 [Alphaproteobacteria bacterium]|nr:hypothetical protein [Alphaproteobacteria bacterium]MCB9699782.1 hypothetical protein [Alphaproteobacteria bacterium]
MRIGCCLAVLGCVACGPRDPCELGARPDTLDEAIALVDELPSPVTLTCYLSSLERPLGLELTSDVFSTQPAQGPESPRIFIRTEHLTMTVVPVGEGKDLLELGEDHASGMTAKAELKFPIVLPLDPEEPYDRILASPGAEITGCQVCHFSEIAIGENRYANSPIRPPDSMLVPLEVLHGAHESCDPTADEERCAMFSALLDHGEVFHSPFPDRFSTQFGP